MARVINFEGRQIEVPDDATDAFIQDILGSGAPTPAPQQSSRDALYARNQPFVKPGTDPASFTTHLPPPEEKDFRTWVQQNDVNFDPAQKLASTRHAGPQDYDMRGFWKGLTTGDPNASTGIDQNDGKLHYTDYWKTPYHESFSAESKFAGPNAPTWQGDQLVGPDGKVYFDDAAQPGGAPYVPTVNDIPHPSEPLMPGLAPPTGDTRAAGAPEPRAAQYVAQQAAHGVADFVGMPGDLTNLAANAPAFVIDKIAHLFGGDFPYRLGLGGSDAAADIASTGFEQAGGQLVPPEEVDSDTRQLGETMRGTVGAAIPAGRLSKVAQAGEEALSPFVRRATNTLAAPYKSSSPLQTVVGDAMAGAGSGAASGYYDEHMKGYLPEWLDPIAKTLAAIIGGVGGSAIDSVGSGLTEAGVTTAQNFVKGKRDMAIPADPKTGLHPRRSDVEAASRIAQDIPSDLPRARANLEQNSADFGQFAQPNEMPTVPMMMDDTGAAMHERAARGSPLAQKFVERDANREALASKQVAASAPEGEGGRAFTDTATSQYDTALADAERKAAEAEQRHAAAQADVQQHQATLKELRARQPDASTRLAGEINKRQDEHAALKNEKFKSVPDETPIPGEPVKQALDEVHAGVPEMAQTGPYAQHRGALDERLRGNPILDAEGNPTGEFETRDLTYGDVRAARSGISESRNATVTGGGSPEFLDRVGKVVNEQADQANPEAAKHYKDVFVPQVKTGEMGEYYNARKRAAATGEESSATAPSKVADKFLKTPEGASRLPALKDTKGADFPQGDATDWMLGELAKSDVLASSGKLRFDKFREWANKNKGIIDQFPEMRTRVDQELATAQKGGMLSEQLAGEVAAAKAGVKTTDSELKRGALGSVQGKDPVNAVAAIMGSGDPERQMTDMANRLNGNQQALDDMKRAVRDWIYTGSGGGSSKSIVGHGETKHVSHASLSKLMDRHEKTLAALYTPEEMNTLRRSQKLMDAGTRTQVKARPNESGSDELGRMEKNYLQASGHGKMVEVALKLWFGMLKGGGINRSINMALSTLPNNETEIRRIMGEFFFNPDVAKHMLNMPLRDRDIPSWNSKLNRLLAYTAGSREATEQKGPPK